MGRLLYKANKGIYRVNHTITNRNTAKSSSHTKPQDISLINEKIKHYDDATRRFFNEEYNMKGEYTTILPKTSEDVYIHATSTYATNC